jgi:hypothetical protein
MFSSDYSVSFKWNSRVGGKRCPVGFPTEVAVTKPNLANGSNNLELEAATKAIAPDWSFDHVRTCSDAFPGMTEGAPCITLEARCQRDSTFGLVRLYPEFCRNAGTARAGARVTLRRHDLPAEIYHLKEQERLPLTGLLAAT